MQLLLKMAGMIAWYFQIHIHYRDGRYSVINTYVDHWMYIHEILNAPIPNDPEILFIIFEIWA